MAISYKSEMSVLDYEEREIVRSTHFPYITELDRDTLEERRFQIRKIREKQKVFVRQKQREASGKGEARGKSFPGTVQRPYQRKQVFSSAIKRLNREIHRLDVFEAREAHGEAARRALDLRRSMQFPERPHEVPPDDGMRSLPSRRRRNILPGAKIGSVSQQNKRSQAKRDRRTPAANMG